MTPAIDPEDFILNASTPAGVNTLPLFHFWGVVVPDARLRAVHAERPPSPALLDRLMVYRGQVTADQAAFDAQFESINDTVTDSWTEFYAARRATYDAAAGQRALAHLDCLIHSYYPEAAVRCD